MRRQNPEPGGRRAGHLGCATTVGQLLKQQTDVGLNPAVVETFNNCGFAPGG